MILLFLAFDGVLHPFSPRSDRPAEESVPFAYLARLEAVLRDHPSLRIVIASDWRKHHTLEELRQFFSEDIRLRIAGVLDIDATDHQVGNRQRRPSSTPQLVHRRVGESRCVHRVARS